MVLFWIVAMTLLNSASRHLLFFRRLIATAAYVMPLFSAASAVDIQAYYTAVWRVVPSFFT